MIRFQRGHPFLKLTLRQQVSNFDPSKWANLGPTRWTSCKEEYCNLTTEDGRGDSSRLEVELCSPKDPEMGQDGSFAILNQYAAYSVPWREWQKFYDEGSVKYVDEMTNNSFLVHYWNHMRVFRATAPILLNPQQPLYKIFKANCPATEKGLLQKMIGSPY